MKIKDNKGSITIFVLVGLLFMTAFLLLSFAENVNRSKIANEQFNMMSSIYSHNDGNASAYERAYAAIRENNKTILEKSVSYSKTLELTNTFEEGLSNYRIYGNTTAVGTYDSSKGKYKIQIKLTDGSGDRTTNIYLSSPLKKSGTKCDYIDYKEQKVIRQVDSQTEEKIELPELVAYEDYTKLEIVTGGIPSKIEVEYVGYTLEGRS